MDLEQGGPETGPEINLNWVCFISRQVTEINN
jgi:hypothetical protein